MDAEGLFRIHGIPSQDECGSLRIPPQVSAARLLGCVGDGARPIFWETCLSFALMLSLAASNPTHKFQAQGREALVLELSDNHLFAGLLVGAVAVTYVVLQFVS
jgi:hypothetical protein